MNCVFFCVEVEVVFRVPLQVVCLYFCIILFCLYNFLFFSPFFLSVVAVLQMFSVSSCF